LCGNLDPIEIDEENVILSGHTRYKALRKLNYTETECIRYTGATEEQKREYRLLANKTGEKALWDNISLAVELEGLDFGGYDFGFDLELETPSFDEAEKAESGASLSDRFIVPPFSVLDARQGYWQNRKRKWRELGIISEIGRGKSLLGDGLAGLAKKYCNDNPQLQGTSIFDPVLCEIMYRWFCTDGGRIFDCFAGGSVRVIIAAYLNHEYIGIDLRQEQIDANYENAAQIGVSPQWYCDDSLNADRYVEDASVDMVFTCPPYADLEVYSDDERDISNMPYEKFCDVYKRILTISCRKLKNDRFFVVVIGDVRDKKGAYRQLVDYTRKILTDNGLYLYNDFVLLESIGTGALRAAKQFNALRKVVKTHESVLVFYKGEIQNIKNNFPALDISEDDLLAECTE
ncbi:MAG: chromosome partitioning protein ParB, partial [Firmicutes bacterium]|nr:chromosome partitioning protein ParB [Bacillota bacterium]